MGDTVNDLLDNLTDAMLAREDSCHGLSRPHERDRAITQWHDAVSAIHAALTREPLPTGTAGVDASIVAIAEQWARADESGNGLAYVVALRDMRVAVAAKRFALAASTRTGDNA